MTGEMQQPEGSEMMVRLATDAVKGVKSMRAHSTADAPGSSTISGELLAIVHENHRQEVIRSIEAIKDDNERRAIEEETIWQRSR